MSVLRIAGLVFSLSLVAACGLFGGKDKGPQPMELTDFDATVRIKRIWSAKLGADAEFLRLALRPAGDGNRIYAASSDGNVTAFDPASGRKIWRVKLDIDLTAGPGVGAGHVVVTSKDGLAVLLDAATGEEQWRVNIAGESLARPLIKDDSVVVQAIDNRLEVLSLFDGRKRWSLVQSPPALTMRGSASPVIVGNTIVAGFDTGRLVAAELDSGTQLWELLLAPPKGRSDLDRLSDIDGAIAVVGQDIYATGYHGRLAAIASESGQVLWNRDISSHEGVAADWNSVYTVKDDGELIALARGNGEELWRNASLLRREPTVPIPFNTMVAVGDFEGYVHFFSSIDGEAVARVRLGHEAISSDPYAIANRLYVQSDSGTMAAYVVVEDRPQRSAPDIADDES